MKRLVGLVAFAGAIGPANALVLIDDFVSPQSLTVTGTGLVTSNGLVTGGAIGGVRRLLGINDVNPNGGVTTIVVGGGFANIASGPRVDPRVEFGYGVNTSGGLVDMNANLLAGGNDRIRVLFDSNDQFLMLRVFLRSTAGTGGSFQLAFNQAVAGGRPTTAFTQDLLFSSILVSPTALGDVDQMIVQFDSTAAGDLSLRSMAAVPEPATLAVLTGGVIALMRRRRA